LTVRNKKEVARRLQKVFRGARTRKRLKDGLRNAKFVDDDDFDYCEVDADYTFHDGADAEWAPVLPVPPADLDFTKVQHPKSKPKPTAQPEATSVSTTGPQHQHHAPVDRSHVRNGGFFPQTTGGGGNDGGDVGGSDGVQSEDEMLHASMAAQLQKFRQRQAPAPAGPTDGGGPHRGQHGPDARSLDGRGDVGGDDGGLRPDTQESDASSFAAGSAREAVKMSKEMRLQQKQQAKQEQEKEIQDEWGFTNAKTAEAMLKRRKKMKRMQNVLPFPSMQ
jgi:hypothetical protein